MTITTHPSIEKWDLTSAVSPFLDRHMMFPLLDYLDTLIEDKTYTYSSKEVAAARLSLLKPTHMVNYAIDIAKELGDDVNEMEELKKKVYEELVKLREGCAALSELCKDEEARVSTPWPAGVHSTTVECKLTVDQFTEQTSFGR